MGARGPVSKRPGQKLGHPMYSQAASEATRVPNQSPSGPTSQPELVFPDGSEPLEVTRGLWESMARSGQAELFQESDWYACMLMVFSIDRLVREAMVKGTWKSAQLMQLRGMLSDMLATEAARRRLKIEVQQTVGEQADSASSVSNLDVAREMFAS